MPAVATRSFAHSRRVRWPLRGGGQARYGSLPQFESERPARTTTQSAFMPRPNVVAAMGSRRLMPLLDPKTQCKQSGPESENETCPGPTVAHSPRTPSKLSMTAARVERSLHTALSRRRTTRPALVNPDGARRAQVSTRAAASHRALNRGEPNAGAAPCLPESSPRRDCGVWLRARDALSRIQMAR